MEAKGINGLFLKRVHASGPNGALRYKRRGRWVEWTWNDMMEKVRLISQGLRALGVGKGDKIGLYATTRPEWSFADLGILGAGGVTVPINHSYRPMECEYIIQQCELKIVIVENPALYARIQEARSRMIHLERVILIEGSDPDDDTVVTWQSLFEMGRDVPEVDRYENTCLLTDENDVFTIVYTPSSYGPPRGVVLKQKAMLAQLEGLERALPLHEHYVTLLFLPFAHIFGRVLQFLCIRTGVVAAYAESYERLLDNIAQVRPHWMAAVPRVYEKIYETTLSRAKSRGDLNLWLFSRAIRTGRKFGRALEDNRKPSMWLSLRYRLSRRLFFDDLHESFGGRLRWFISSGAPLNKPVAEAFRAAGIMILEGFGMTETCGAATVNTLNYYKLGTVGKSIHGVQTVTDDDGEVLIRGPIVMEEYYDLPDDTAKAFTQDRWLKTGDIGEIDGEGFLSITDRKKNLIVTSTGKNISPQNIENLLRDVDFVEEILVHGDKRNYLTALVTLERKRVEKWAEERNIGSGGDWHALCEHPEVIKLVETGIQEKNQYLASYETIKKFHIVPEAFSAKTGELTITGKLRRRFIEEKYKEIIDRFYT